MTQLKRFLHLEGRRKAKDPATPGEPSASSRFASLERPADAEPGEAPLPATTVQRFERQVSEPPLTTAESLAEEQPFRRCMHCQLDSHRYAQECPQCGNSLTTPEQQEFNRALWEERLQHRHEEVRALEEARQVRAENQVALEEAYRQLKTGSGLSGGVAPGMWLLRQIEDSRWRLGVIVGGLLAYATFSVIELSGGRAAFRLWVLVTAGLVVLFLPPRIWLASGRRWDDD